MPQIDHQQELVNIVKAAHQTLALARKARSNELARRLSASKLRLRQEFERALEATENAIQMDMEAEIEAHAANLDEALIAAYDEGITIRRLAVEGFGNRYDGGVQQLLVKLREDGRLGTREGHQRNTSKPEDIDSHVSFPKPIDIEAILSEAVTIDAPTFSLMADKLVLAEAWGDHDEITADGVLLTMDPRDSWFKRIGIPMRPNTPWQNATTATLFLHPATGVLTTRESTEDSELYWDHPVSRWVKTHPVEAREGFNAALAA